MARQHRCNSCRPAPSGDGSSWSWNAPSLRSTISSTQGETNVTAPLTGYADRISVRAGEKIAFKISSAGPGPYQRQLVRIVRGDPNPGGAGPSSKISRSCSTAASPRASSTRWPGSYALIEGAKDVQLAGALAVEALIWPTLPERRAADRDLAPRSRDRRGLRPGADARRHGARKSAAPGSSVGKTLRARTWYRVWASADPSDRHAARRPATAEARLRHRRRGRGQHDRAFPRPRHAAARPDRRRGGADRPAQRCFNGKIEAPRSRASPPGTSPAAWRRWRSRTADPTGCMAGWSTCRRAP